MSILVPEETGAGHGGGEAEPFFSRHMGRKSRKWEWGRLVWTQGKRHTS